ncbi:hypothetical protein GCM10027451_13630 [Geodermatophilus aquaeductus]|uniref:Uncharacterized protein n=1 Tax=Geodermatophilus aquaeductus TaxID=1564161 RepID=A0A521BCC3_9ACTN|nr:hypothetical protein [Geodermatophilus aquaeductus]SMO44733.1 hypothetical protein SAMN06273567_101657 [Geodermatophilus aquaeductus]
MAPTSRPRPLRAVLVLLLALAALLVPGTASASGGDDGAAEGASSGGDFAVTVNGRTSNPGAGNEYRLRDTTPTAPIAVRGRHVTFTIAPATLGVYDYTLTGAPDPQRMVTAPTVVFASKVPVLTPAQLRGVRISELRLRDDVLVVTFATASGGKLKVQAKDAPQGGIFQMEQEFGGAVEYVHTLGAGLFYFVNEYTGKINFGNGVAADATHQMLLGKDSPQVATKLEQTATTTRWSVASGGRMGGVLGEDSIELSAGATNCTSDCQARNRIQGSVPVPPDPTNPTPIG